MRKFLTKFISLLLIFNLLFVGGFSAVGQVIAQSESAPTSAERTESAPSDPKLPSEEKPTSAPQATSAPTQPQSTVAPTSAVQSTTNPQPTLANSGTPTQDPSLTESVSESSNTNTSDGGIADQQNQGNDSVSAKTNDSSVNDPANIGTGPLSDNFASEINKKTVEIVNNNLAQLQNKIDAISNSGFNYANFNTLQGQVFTGDSMASLNLLNKLNSNMTGLGGFSVFNVYDNQYGDIIFKFADGSPVDSFISSSPTVAKNSVTGSGSNNNALADNSFTVKEANGNDAQLVNDINLQAVTGENSALYNTGNGEIKTGDATALGNIVNLANTNLNVSQWLFGVVNIFGTLSGNIILPQNSGNNNGNNNSATLLAQNSNTGPLSTNNVTYNANETSNYTSNNTTDISNSLNVTANSGNNTSSVNTGGGSVQSGSSDASVSNTTIANANTIQEEGTVWMVIVSEAGKWVGHIIGAPWGATTASNSLPLSQVGSEAGNQTYSTLLANDGTGPSSNNNATYNQTADQSASNENNASITNNITANADTGDNQAQFNTGAGQIETGDAKVGLNLVNMVNTNVIAKKFVAVLVNVLGNFLGNVVTPGQQNQQLANSNSNGSSQTVNSNTQPIPTPTTYQIPSFDSSTVNIGGLPSSLSASTANTDNYAGSNVDYVQEHEEAVYKVSVSQKKVVTQARLLSQGPPKKYIVLDQANKLKRGIFISPAFAKATETSFAGMLLGGATFKVTQSWLSVIPLAFLLILLRRRRKIDFSKYLNAILEIIL